MYICKWVDKLTLSKKRNEPAYLLSSLRIKSELTLELTLLTLLTLFTFGREDNKLCGPPSWVVNLVNFNLL